MLGNMLNDLAEAIRRWTEKKKVQMQVSEN